MIPEIIMGLAAPLDIALVAEKVAKKPIVCSLDTTAHGLSVQLTTEQQELCVDKDILLIHTIADTTGKQIDEICAMAAAARKAGAVRITLMLPYFAYARLYNDKDGAAPELQAAAARLSNAVETIFFFELHRKAVMDLFPVACMQLTLTNLLVHAVLQANIPFKNIVIVAPDYGARERAQQIAQSYSLPVVYFTKQRMPDGTVSVHSSARIPVESLAIIVDDIIDTGKTVAAVAYDLAARVQAVVACVAHAVCSTPLADYLDTLPLDRLFLTNSLVYEKQERVSVLDIHEVLGHTIKTMDEMMIKSMQQYYQMAQAPNLQG